MSMEQEGIDLKVNQVQDDGSIILPDTETEVEENVGNNSTDTVNDEAKDDKEEKESLKRGVNRERNLRKAAERKNKELETRIKALEESANANKKTTVEELIEDGIDENVAKSIAKAIESKQKDNSALVKQLADVKFEKSLTEKSKEEGFEDIEDFADEIKELVDKGLTLEQSYYAVTYDKSKTQDTKSEIERKVEAKIQNTQARKNILSNINNNGAIPNNKNKINASAEEKAIAAMSGMSIEEYVAIRDMNSVKDYEKYKSAKKK